LLFAVLLLFACCSDSFVTRVLLVCVMVCVLITVVFDCRVSLLFALVARCCVAAFAACRSRCVVCRLRVVVTFFFVVYVAHFVRLLCSTFSVPPACILPLPLPLFYLRLLLRYGVCCFGLRSLLLRCALFVVFCLLLFTLCFTAFALRCCRLLFLFVRCVYVALRCCVVVLLRNALLFVVTLLLQLRCCRCLRCYCLLFVAARYVGYSVGICWLFVRCVGAFAFTLHARWLLFVVRYVVGDFFVDCVAVITVVTVCCLRCCGTVYVVVTRCASLLITLIALLVLLLITYGCRCVAFTFCWLLLRCLRLPLLHFVPRCYVDVCVYFRCLRCCVRCWLRCVRFVVCVVDVAFARLRCCSALRCFRLRTFTTRGSFDCCCVVVPLRYVDFALLFVVLFCCLLFVVGVVALFCCCCLLFTVVRFALLRSVLITCCYVSWIAFVAFVVCCLRVCRYVR
jgi:hypothetical protein